LPDFIQKVVDKVKTENAPVAIVVRKGTFSPYSLKSKVITDYEMNREMAIENILDIIPSDSCIVSTTGKASREVFEYRVRNKQGNRNDFLTVGSMGHCSQIALGVSLNFKGKTICLDGDGAAIMHLGSLAIIGQNIPSNFLHILINNGAHDSVGGQPTVGFELDFKSTASASGYKSVFSVSTVAELRDTLESLDYDKSPIFLEVKVNKGARKDLGRPTSTPIDNKTAFMNFLKDSQ
jgi:phosphonopyruvate decarboxylase